MQIYLSSSQGREADKNAANFGLPTEVLMKRAARAIAEEVQKIASELEAKSVLIVCGTGNNGGDGYIIARELMARGVDVSVFAFEGDMTTACKREKKRYTGKYVRTIGGKLIVDCIFGTGLNRNVSDDVAAVIKKMNSCGAYIISADLPSGLNGDNGRIMCAAVKADLTIALSYPKIGCILDDGIDHCGKIIVKDIGVVAGDHNFAQVVDDADMAKYFKAGPRNIHKGSFGSACIVAGSEKYLGAAVMAISTALRSGCGYVYAVVPEKLKYSLAAMYPQCIFVDKPVDASAIAVGMGMGCTKETYDMVCSILKNYKGKLIIDADGLNALAQYGKEPLKTTKAKVLLTPHIGEMAKFSALTVDGILSDPVGITQFTASEYGVNIHLKSAVSMTCDGKTATLTTRGTSALAKAGSGDMLAGLICGFAARGLSVYDAAICGQYVLGMTGEICSEEYGYGQVTAAEISANIYKAIKCLSKLN